VSVDPDVAKTWTHDLPHIGREVVFNQRSFDSYGSTELMWFLTRQKKGARLGP